MRLLNGMTRPFGRARNHHKGSDQLCRMSKTRRMTLFPHYEQNADHYPRQHRQAIRAPSVFMGVGLASLLWSTYFCFAGRSCWQRIHMETSVQQVNVTDFQLAYGFCNSQLFSNFNVWGKLIKRIFHLLLP